MSRGRLSRFAPVGRTRSAAIVIVRLSLLSFLPLSYAVCQGGRNPLPSQRQQWARSVQSLQSSFVCRPRCAAPGAFVAAPGAVVWRDGFHLSAYTAALSSAAFMLFQVFPAPLSRTNRSHRGVSFNLRGIVLTEGESFNLSRCPKSRVCTPASVGSFFGISR